MKGDAMRRSGELLKILQRIAAFVGMGLFFWGGPSTMASIQTGLWGSAKARRGFGKLFQSVLEYRNLIFKKENAVNG